MKNKTTPQINYERYKSDCEKLDEAIEDKDIRNIAVSGILGAGKSSLIKTYDKAFNNKKGKKIVNKYNKKQNSKDSSNTLDDQLEKIHGKSINKSIRISLANFNVVNDKQLKKEKKDSLKGNNEATLTNITDQIKKDIENLDYYKEDRETNLDVNEVEIEKSLLQQFIFNVPSCALPDSHIRRVEKRFAFKTFALVSFIIFLISAAVYFTNKFNILWTNDIIVDKIIISIGILSLLVLLSILPFIFKLKSLKVDTFEIKAEYAGNDKQDLLNKYSDEIIYFFEKSKVKIVYFEDLDRLPNLNIFNKLREINYLLNNTTYIKHKIVFVYCVSDDIISDSEERNKFFDLILTVSPYLTQESVKKHIIQELGDKQNVKVTDFCENMSRFITDSRMLSNIINDFKEIVKKNKLSQTEDKIKAFTLSIYKNLYYYDFNKLNNNNDCISKSFTLVDNYKNNEIEKLKDDINNKKKILKESFLNKEARIHFFKERLIGILTLNINNTLMVRQGQQGKNIADINGIEDFESNENFYVYLSNYNLSYYSNKSNIVNYWNEHSDVSFDLYKQEILFSDEDKRNDTINEIELLNQKIKSIYTLPVSNFMRDYKYSLTQDTTKFLNISFLNGYIESDYRQFIFGRDNDYLVQQDDIFVRYNNFGSNNELVKNNYDYQLANVPVIISQVQENRFGNKTILNDMIVSFVLNSQEESLKKKKENLKNLLLKDDEEVANYFEHYIRDKEYSDFYNLINTIGIPKVLFKVFLRIIGSISLDKQNKYMQFLLENVDHIEGDEHEVFKLINNYTEWSGIKFNNGIIEKLKNRAQNGNCTFKLESISKFDEASFELIIKNQAFAMNYENLSVIAKRKYDVKLEDLLQNVLVEQESVIKELILENIQEFLKIVPNSHLQEKEIITLLKENNLTTDIKLEFIKQTDFVIEKGFDDLHQDIISEIIKNDKFSKNIGTVFHIYEICGFDIIKTYFSEENFKSLIINIDDIKSSKHYDEFLNNIKSLYLQENACDIMNSFGITDVVFDGLIDPVFDERIKKLIEAGNVSFHDQNFNMLINCPHSYMSLVLKNINSFKEWMMIPGKLNLSKEAVTFLLCNINNSEFESSILNDFADKIDFTFADNIGGARENYFGRIVLKIKASRITNANIINSLFSIRPGTNEMKKDYIDLIFANQGLFDNTQIIDKFKMVDSQFIQVFEKIDNERNADFAVNDTIIYYGLSKLKEMGIIQYRNPGRSSKIKVSWSV